MRKTSVALLISTFMLTPLSVMADTGVLLEDIEHNDHTLKAGTQVQTETIQPHVYQIKLSNDETVRVQHHQLLPITQTKRLYVTPLSEESNLYTKPSLFSSHLLTITQDERLYPTGVEENGWLKVKTSEGIVGWLPASGTAPVLGDVAIQTKGYVQTDELETIGFTYGDDVSLMFADAESFTLTDGQVVDKGNIGFTKPPNRVKFVNPLPSIGRITSMPGYRIHPVYKTRRYHKGVDVSVPTGTPITSTMKGVVTKVSRSRTGYGYHVEVTSDSYRALYAHLSAIHVSKGQVINMGESLGLSGNTGTSTGPHLHFELWKEGQLLDTSYLVKQMTYNQDLPLAP